MAVKGKRPLFVCLFSWHTDTDHKLYRVTLIRSITNLDLIWWTACPTVACLSGETANIEVLCVWSIGTQVVNLRTILSIWPVAGIESGACCSKLLHLTPGLTANLLATCLCLLRPAGQPPPHAAHWPMTKWPLRGHSQEWSSVPEAQITLLLKMI